MLKDNPTSPVVTLNSSQIPKRVKRRLEIQQENIEGYLWEQSAVILIPFLKLCEGSARESLSWGTQMHR
jgi:hypothetical protein